MSRIKICGIRTQDDVNIVNELLPEFAGFIFYTKSRRYIPPEKALSLRKQMDSRIKTVGVFVSEDIDRVINVSETGAIDLIQLHGNESEEYIEKLRESCDKPIIKAFGVSSSEDIRKAEKSPADYILLDNTAAGSGESFTWSLVRSIKREWFLAGGLDSENVGEALKLLKPYAVDVSSGVETDGKKDREKTKSFIEAVKKHI